MSRRTPIRPASDAAAAPRFRPLVLLLFAGSGFTSLVLEVVWTRMLGTVFGNTVLAASTVLTVFMLGLALGSAVLGGRVDRSQRPLMWYGWLEVGVGLYAAMFPVLLAGVGEVFRGVYQAVAPGPGMLNAMRFLLSALLLLPPTFLMGGTLPALSRHLGLRQDQPGQQVGYLYAWNTLGGVAGCFAAGFVLLEWLGVRGTLWVAALGALAVGVTAVVVGRRTLTGAEVASPRLPPVREVDRAPSAADPNLFLWVLIAYGVAGFCALAYQVIWTRILIFVLTTTVYAFATMLTTFLTGLALGSLASARWLVPRIVSPLRWFGALQLLVGLAALGSVPLLANLGAIDAGISGQVGWGGLGGLTVTYLANNFVVLLLPTFLMGAVFPVVTTLLLRGEALLGRRVGQIYAANTIGCVVGAWLAGFVLVPLLGTHTSLLLVVGLNLAVGVALFWRALDGRRVYRAAVAGGALAVAAAAFVSVPANIFHRTINLYRNPSRLLYLEEHSTATVTVHELPNRDLLMVTDGVDVAGTDLMLRTTQKLQGYLPLCLHPQPRRVLQIGFGSGETTRVGLEFGVEDYSVVEISPAVFNAAAFFEAINRGSPRDPRVRRIIMDGKNHVLLTPRQYDLIMNDSIFPGSSGSAALYTVDHFRRCRERLADGGMLSCWVPLDLRPRELRMILKSFQSVFPHTSFWVASNTLNKQGLILGTLEPLRIDFARVAALLRRPAIQADLAEVAIPDVYDLLDCHMVDEAAIRRMVADDPVNTDDRPLLEFSCARRIPWPVRLRQTLAMLTAHRAPVGPYVFNWSDPACDPRELDRRFRSTTHVFNAQVAQLADLPKARRTELDLAQALSSDDPQVRSCEAELEKEIEDLRALVDAYPRQQTFTVRLAKKLFLALRWEEAARLYEPMIRDHSPPPPEVFTHLAEIRHHFGDTAGAEELLRRGLEVWPRSHQAHDLLAGLLLQTGRLAEARHHIETALAIQPGDPLLLRHRDEIFRRSGAP